MLLLNGLPSTRLNVPDVVMVATSGGQKSGTPPLHSQFVSQHAPGALAPAHTAKIVMVGWV